MRSALALSLVLLAFSSMGAADQLYKWVDAQGNVHYSDKPQPGANAKKLKLPPPTTYNAPVPLAPTGSDAPADQAADESGRQPYTVFEIATPQPNSTLWNVSSVNVTLNISPGLQAGDHVTITLDGKVQGPLTTTAATFDGLERGEHSVSANLQQTDGSVMIAKPVTFYIQQTSIKRPP